MALALGVGESVSCSFNTTNPQNTRTRHFSPQNNNIFLKGHLNISMTVLLPLYVVNTSERFLPPIKGPQSRFPQTHHPIPLFILVSLSTTPYLACRVSLSLFYAASTMQLFTALLTALALVSSVTALPVAVTSDASRRSDDIVFSPTIKTPSQGTVWKIGSKQVVTWDASNIPQGAEGNTGTIMLGYNDNTGSENLDYGELHSVDPTALHNPPWGTL